MVSRPEKIDLLKQLLINFHARFRYYFTLLVS